jgi:2-keto-4-pentenoate hydratase/2-oxohepta-3-ene-1,7-dioic acid hydratase in catechol pathway
MFLDGRWALGKGYDTFCPVGPVIETDTSVQSFQIETFVDGQSRRRGRTSDILHSVPELIVYISEVFTLSPGDLLLSGTPPGRGSFEAGQIIDIRIEGIGMLSNPARNQVPQLT